MCRFYFKRLSRTELRLAYVDYRGLHPEVPMLPAEDGAQGGTESVGGPAKGDGPQPTKTRKTETTVGKAVADDGIGGKVVSGTAVGNDSIGGKVVSQGRPGNERVAAEGEIAGRGTPMEEGGSQPDREIIPDPSAVKVGKEPRIDPKATPAAAATPAATAAPGGEAPHAKVPDSNEPSKGTAPKAGRSATGKRTPKLKTKK